MENRADRFTGKVAIVTGAAGGIGSVTVRRLLAEGAEVVLSGRREEPLLAMARTLDADGRRTAVVPGDVGQVQTSRNIVHQAIERFGGIDILINNAGVFRPGGFLETSTDDLEISLNTNFKGTFYVSQAVIPEMRKRGGGAIVNVGSMLALLAVDDFPSAAYSAAKAAVLALTRNLAIEFAMDRVRVNAVAPAVVETAFFESCMSRELVRKALVTLNKFHPVGRNGQPEDIAAAILFLASDEAGWITGTTMGLDGGASAGRRLPLAFG